MKITVEKIDDINFILRGNVDNSVIEEKVADLKATAAANKTEDDDTSADNIEQDAAGLVFKEFIDAGIKEAKLKVENILGQPGLKKYEQQESSVYFEVEIAISPDIDVDIDYAELVPTYTKPDAEPGVVEKKMEEFALQQAPFTKLETPRALINGDVGVIDFTGFIDDKTFEGGSAEKFNLKVGSNSFIPGFEEQLVGMKYNEQKDVMVTFPEDYSSEDLAGKEAKFVVKLHEIQEQAPVTLDDEFAKKVYGDPTATIDKLRTQMSEQATAEALSQIYMSDLKPKIIKNLLAKYDFTLPNNIVEQEIDAKVREKTRTFSEDQHKEYMEDKGKFAELRESVREEAKASIKMSLIVEALAKKEGIDVHEQEVIGALGYQATMTGQDPEKLVQYYRDNNLMISAKMGLTEDKLFGHMLGFHKA